MRHKVTGITRSVRTLLALRWVELGPDWITQSQHALIDAKRP